MVVLHQSEHLTQVTSLRAQFLLSTAIHISTSDIDVGLNDFIATYAEDTRSGNVFLSDHDRQSHQEDLCSISTCVWPVDKCQILQVGTEIGPIKRCVV